jgi:signal peptidase complex subunit 1
MDFVGQQLAESILVKLLLLFGAVGFIAGYVFSDFQLMAYINAAGLVLTLLVVLPDWPWYNKNKPLWLPPLKPDESGAPRLKAK